MNDPAENGSTPGGHRRPPPFKLDAETCRRGAANMLDVARSFEPLLELVSPYGGANQSATLWSIAARLERTDELQTPEDRGDALAQFITGGQIGRFEGLIKGFNDDSLLARIAGPTLLLAGEFDLMTPEANKAMLPLLQQGRYAEIPSAGHTVQIDRPEAWRASVADFIAQHDG